MRKDTYKLHVNSNDKVSDFVKDKQARLKGKQIFLPIFDFFGGSKVEESEL